MYHNLISNVHRFSATDSDIDTVPEIKRCLWLMQGRVWAPVPVEAEP